MIFSSLNVKVNFDVPADELHVHPRMFAMLQEALLNADVSLGNVHARPTDTDRLRVALHRYGGHRIGCAAVARNATADGTVRGKRTGPNLTVYTEECDCGFDEVKKL